MADNTTTYKAVVETEVKGGDEIEQLGDQAEETAGKFTKLQLQIRQTNVELQKAAESGDKVKFNQLRKQLDDLEDGLEKVQMQSKQFEDQLSALPGPAGQAGNAIKGIDGAFKLLAANPVVAIIGALVGLFLLLKRSLESTAEGQATLNRVSQAFSAVLGPILATLEKVAVPLFNGLAFVIEKVAKAFAFFAEKMGISSEKIKEATLSVDKVQQDVNEKEKKRLEDLEKKQEEARKKKQEADQKAIEKRKKQLEEQKKNEEEATKVLTESYLSTLGERDKEIYQRGEKLNADILALQKAGIKDLSSVKQAYKLDEDKINKKYDDEEKKKKEDADKETADKLKESEEKAKTKRQKDLEDKVLGVETEMEFDAQTFDQRIQLVNEKEALLLQGEDLTENQKTAISKAASQERKNIRMAELEAKAEIQNAELDLAGQFGSLLKELAGKNKKVAIAGVIVEQAAAIGKILVNTGIANAKSVAASPLTFGQPWVTINTISAALSIASSVAAGAKAIQQINSADSGGSGVSGGTTPSSAAPSAPQVASAPVPQIQTEGGANPTSQIAQTIAASSGRPVKAYVVQQDVASQTAFARRTNSAATL